MLFSKRFWPGIADGTVMLTFRRWKRPQVMAGRPYRTAAGIIDVTSVTNVTQDEITDRDAMAAGYADAENPARRAGDLAKLAGRERAPFKLDVRKLKLGLTESLDIGYRLSPRGRTYLDRSSG